MKNTQKSPALRTLVRYACAASLLAALAPHAASAATAGSAANAKILNVVTVTYRDASGNNEHKAATSTSINVALKQAAMTVSTAQPFEAVDSGSTATTYVALTANANGLDTYTVGVTPSAATNLSPDGHTITNKVFYDIDGTEVDFSSGRVTLGATSIVSVADGTVTGTQVLSVPAGTVTTNGLSVGSTVVIGTTSYKVLGVDNGKQATYSIANTASTSTGSLEEEELGTIVIGADYFGAVPTLATGTTLAGTLVAERKYLQIQDTARVSSITEDGSEKFTVDTNTTTGSNVTTGFDAGTAVFYFTQLTIFKKVDNIDGGTGKPGDLLEYTITVENTSNAGKAALVAVDDAVPAYTTLVAGSDDVFATIAVGSKTAPITLDVNNNISSSSTDVGFGGTAGGLTSAGTKINFFLGTGATKTSGGAVAAKEIYTIKYRVRIN